MHAEAFTDIRYVERESSAKINEAVANGSVDFNTHFEPQWVSVVDGGGPTTSTWSQLSIATETVCDHL